MLEVRNKSKDFKTSSGEIIHLFNKELVFIEQVAFIQQVK